MLPIIDGTTKSGLEIKTGRGKKRYGMSYSFHLDTGDIAHKAMNSIQDTAEKGYDAALSFVKEKYRTLKVKKVVHHVKSSLRRKIKLEIPIVFKVLKYRLKEVVHA